MAFRGSYDHTLDAKNRLTIPARFRTLLAGVVVMSLTADQTPCVSVWRADDHDEATSEMLQRMDQAEALPADLDTLRRFFYGTSFEAELDASGRLMLPAELIDQAQLDREVAVVGVGNHLEIWSRSRWSDHQKRLLSEVGEMTRRPIVHPA